MKRRNKLPALSLSNIGDYRIQFPFRPNDTFIEVMYYGLSDDEDAEGYYENIESLPLWMQERLAVLFICESRFESKDGVVDSTEAIDGVGQRISQHIYWVHSPSAI